MNIPWFIVGISGVSCSGKTTLTNSIRDRLLARRDTAICRDIKVHSVQIIHQDNYYHPIDSPLHEWIPDLKHINRERLGALDTDRMLADVETTLGTGHILYTKSIECQAVNVLIIEGHLVFNYAPINRLFHQRLCMQISFERCQTRRHGRVYPQPTPAGYFERFVWPLYDAFYKEFGAIDGLHVLNGDSTAIACLDEAMVVLVKSFDK